jgi:hypothetical protein
MIKSHWNLRYIINRVKYEFYLKLHPKTPWLTKGAVNLLNEILLTSDNGIEFGSGRSTVWFSSRVNHLTSVEHNSLWYNSVKKELISHKITNVDLILSEDKSYFEILEEISDLSLDFILVDGIYRDEVLMKGIDKVKAGGIIIFDNANRYLNNPVTVSPNSVKSPPNEKWGAIYQKLKSSRFIWTTNGVWDTLVLIKTERRNI